MIFRRILMKKRLVFGLKDPRRKVFVVFSIAITNLLRSVKNASIITAKSI
jgi:hypothetical protein